MSFVKASSISLLTLSICVTSAQAAEQYEFPVTVRGYEGPAQSSVSYSGQSARHVLHDSLMAAIGNMVYGQYDDNLALLNEYFAASGDNRAVLAPAGKEGFVTSPAVIDAISADKNLAGKAYRGAVTSWPGNLNAQQVLADMIARAADTDAGFDPAAGHDYQQLISKFAMGAVFYNQAVDHYLEIALDETAKPNGQPYAEGAAYTGKEHVWDEAFGYFGAPANALNLTADEVYAIAKQNAEVAAKADTNGDGVINLHGEMAYAHAYYAADFDRSGKSDYLHTIVQAFIDGREIISKANGKDLSNRERRKLAKQVEIIKTQWERVIAEATFKYAGEVYEDIEKLNILLENNGDISTAFRNYVKHWGELKGFSMALQMGGKDLGEFGFELNELIGFSPVLIGDSQITGVNANGEFIQQDSISLSDYRLNMMRVQKELVENFDLSVRAADVMSELGNFTTGGSAEID